MQKKSYRLHLCLLALSIGLSSCGLGEKKDASQVAAKVNGAEITVHQINQVLSHSTGVTPENADKARKEILEHLIVQELAVAKATDSKLDRTPDVIMALDAARREILARAYFNQLSGSSANVEKADTLRYFEGHPELFSHRRIYSLADIALQRDDKLIASLRNMVAENKSVQDIARWLKENGIKFEANSYTNSAEQLSLELLPRIAKLGDGQTDVIVIGEAVHVISVIKSKEEPVDFATAAPQIKQYLSSEGGKQKVSTEIKKLRDTAKVEYLGEFAAEKPQVTSAPPTVPAADAKAAAAESIAKGAAGLK